MEQNLKIGSWNVHGLGSKIKDSDFVHSVNNLDICFLMETWADEKVYMPDKYVYCKNALKKSNKNGRKSGGITVIISEQLRKATKIYKDTEYGVWLKICKSIMKIDKDIYICGIYVPPTNSEYAIDQPFEQIENDVSELPGNCYTLLVGDFNARTGELQDIMLDSNTPEIETVPIHANVTKLGRRLNMDLETNTYGRKLIKSCMQSDMFIANGRIIGDIPGNITYFHSKGTSTIDYAIASHNMIGKIKYCNVLPLTHFSDHCMLKLNIGIPKTNSISLCQDNNKNTLKPLPIKFKWNEASKIKFLNNLQNPQTLYEIRTLNSKQYKSPEDVQSLCQNITDIFKRTANASLQRIKIKSSPKRKVSTYIHNQNLTTLKNHLTNLAKTLRKYPNDPLIRGKYFTTKKTFTKTIKKQKIKEKNEIINKINDLQDKNPSSFWALINKIKEKKESQEAIDPQIFFDHFKDLHATKHSKNFDDNFAKQIEEEIKSNSEQIHIMDLDKEISLKEIITATKSLKNKKASGFDSISNEMIKCSINVLGSSIQMLFNAILKSEHFPAEWSKGIIIPLFKSGDQYDAGNYRGITISNCLGKLLTKILNTRLLNYLIETKVITRTQIGFLPKHRTADHLLVLKTIIDTFKKSRKKLFICFVDFKKAFDTVFRKGLIYKMMKLKISSKFINLLTSMYNNTTACVKNPKGLTTTFPINVGTKQGCNLSPTLFNIFLNDLPSEFIKGKCDPIKIDDKFIPCLMYADDLVIFSKSEKGLTECLKNLENYCNKWQLTVNIKKTKIMIINKPKTALYDFKIYKSKIEMTPNYTYLGIIFNQQGTFKQAIELLTQKGLRAYYAIRKDFNFYNNTTAKTQIKLFETMVQPILLYGSEVWGIFGWRSNTPRCIKQYILNQKHPFEAVHTKMCKNALGVHKHASDLMAKAEMGRYPLIANIIKYVASYWQHILSMESGELLADTYKSLNKKTSKTHLHYCNRFKMLMSTIKIEHIIPRLPETKIKTASNQCKTSIYKMYEDFFFKTIREKAARTDSGGRFELYGKIKFNYNFENYLSLDNRLRRQITSLRISTHNLPIELLRKHKVDRNLRKCNCCNSGDLGSEIHILLHCSNSEIVHQRNTLFNILLTNNHQWQLLSDTDKFIYLLCAHDKMFNFNFAIFLEKVFKIVSKQYSRN